MWLCKYEEDQPKWKHWLVRLCTYLREWKGWDQPVITLQEGGWAKEPDPLERKKKSELEDGARDAWLRDNLSD